jgi:transcriptional regulator with XRE-family HTH domain
MSMKKNKKIPGVGIRITQERKRLGYSQAALSAKLGKATLTQISYESDETRPDADYFFSLDELGADIYYIITGRQLEALKEDDERQLLADFRSFDEREKTIMLNLFHDMTQSEVSNKKIAANKISGKTKIK